MCVKSPFSVISARAQLPIAASIAEIITILITNDYALFMRSAIDY